MKTLKIILVCLICFLTSELVKSQIVVKEDQSFFYYDGKTSDTLGADSAMHKIISIKEPGFYNYNIDVDVDSAGNGSAVTVYLQARMNYMDDWATLTTVSWTGSVDTVITFSNLTNSTISETVAQHTITTAAFDIIQDSASAQLNFADTIRIPAQTQTVAAQTITTTITQGGVIWPELRLFFQGASSSSDVSLDDIVGIINRKKIY